MTTKTVTLEVTYEDGKLIGDNSEEFVAQKFDGQEVVSFKMYGDLLNVVTKESARETITSHKATRVEKELPASEPAQKVATKPEVTATKK